MSQQTPLHALHNDLHGKMVPFAGYDMPVHYPTGILKEHLHTRAKAGLFDISHMGQVTVEGADILRRLESLIPSDLQELGAGQTRYGFLLKGDGGVIDDLMVTNLGGDKAFLVLNASRKEVDVACIQEHLPDVTLTRHEDRALLALQGPEAVHVLSRFVAAVAHLKFMQAGWFDLPEVGACFISRSGYTGEDGFELSVPAATVEKFARQLLAQPEVLPIGLGARDSLRLEAGLCLYGHELDEAITPIESSLTWAIGKRRRGEGGFVGAEILLRQIKEGAPRKRVGLRPEGRALARENTEIQDGSGRKIGIVTSGGFGASLDAPVCMGIVETAFAKTGTQLFLIVRGKPLPATVVALPFVPHRYVKG